MRKIESQDEHNHFHATTSWMANPSMSMSKRNLKREEKTPAVALLANESDGEKSTRMVSRCKSVTRLHKRSIIELKSFSQNFSNKDKKYFVVFG